MSNHELEHAVIKPAPKFSAVWLLPILALCIAGWLLYKNLAEDGITITVAFDNGRGIEAKKTPVMYQGVQVGQVASLDINEDLNGVVATIKLRKKITPLIQKHTIFWLVQPQISLSGVSGLDTLVAGNYISFKPAEGGAARHFMAANSPPANAENTPGLRLVITAKTLGTLAIGAPVLYQELDVGDIENYQLTDNGVDINIRIEPQYQHLVNTQSQFWKHSGIKINANLQGISVETGPIASIIAGGIAFSSEQAGEASSNGQRFQLFDDHNAAQGSELATVYFRDANGLSAGNAVRMAGITVGKVERIAFARSNPNDGIHAVLRINAAYADHLNTATQFWMIKPEVSSEGVSGLDTIISGPYIAMRADGKQGPTASIYTALDKSPENRISAPGLRVRLRTEELNSVRIGSKVYYRKIAVGQVEEVSLDRDGVNIGLFIHQKYRHLLQRNSKFWNTSGISISGGLGGLEVQMDSVASVIAGGIAFHTPDIAKPQAAWENLKYTLYPNFESSSADQGTDITIGFSSGASIKKGTALKYQGINVGEVSSVELSKNMNAVSVKAKLVPSASAMAQEGSEFWVVKPQLGLVGTSNLDTLFTGSYIAVRPGAGESRKEFNGLDTPPSIRQPNAGLNLIVTSPHLGSIKEGVKVYYRDIPVGEVFGYELAADARSTEIHLNIEPRYVKLVQTGSQFWNISGIDIELGLFSGAKIRVNALEALLAGGISFATPEISDDTAAPVQPGHRYPLHPKVNRKWLRWAPQIDLSQSRSGD